MEEIRFVGAHLRCCVVAADEAPVVDVQMPLVEMEAIQVIVEVKVEEANGPAKRVRVFVS